MMWVLSGVGVMELIFLFLAIGLACCFGRRGRRWMAAVGPLMVLAVLVSPPDIVSMLVVVIPLALAFSLGVYWGPRLLSPETGNASRKGEVA
jgi:Sec-independent protein secretion pathway component TatC